MYDIQMFWLYRHLSMVSTFVLKYLLKAENNYKTLMMIIDSMVVTDGSVAMYEC